MLRARRVGVALAAAVLLGTSACSGSDPEPKPPFTSYVAMGDSSVAGPGIVPINLVSGACARSRSNWPALLAKALKVPEVKDVSCSGAVSADILRPRTGSGAGAQTDALSEDTDLVTISIGGNDEGVYSKVILACLAGAYASDKACSSFMSTKLEPMLDRTSDRVTAALEGVRSKAPNARVVLVGYLRMLPAADGCAIPGLKPARTGPAADAWEALDTTMRTAAERAEVEYVSMAAASTGHESCNGDEAWVNGLSAVPSDGAALHPNSAGMRAVARIVADHLTG